jgi:hypothetical protein
MDITHRLHVTSSPAGLLFECADGCNRRLVVDGRSGEMTVIDRGDPFARHVGANGGVELGPVVIGQA